MKGTILVIWLLILQTSQALTANPFFPCRFNVPGRQINAQNQSFFSRHYRHEESRHQRRQQQRQPLIALRLSKNVNFSTKSTVIMKDLSSLCQAVGRSLQRVFTLLRNELSSLNTNQQLLFLGMFLLGFFLGRSRRIFGQRYTKVSDIPSFYFGPNAPILTGRAVSISDGDTIRLLHTPMPWSAKQLAKGEKISEVALPIRLCTIDAPETAKFGNKGQPFGKDAKDKLASLLENKTVNVRLLQSDQYGRAVAQVFVRNFLGQPSYMDEIMLRSGLAEVYTGGGAVYGPKGLDAYLAMQEKAKKALIGIWSQSNRESAADYKKRTKS